MATADNGELMALENMQLIVDPDKNSRSTKTHCRIENLMPFWFIQH